jgi:hypothetical protein
MSTLKTPDNATLPEPIGSPRQELRRQQTKGREMAAKAQSRSARQAKERTIPKKPKPGPKTGEPEKPYEATPAEKEAARRVLARREGRSSAPKVSIRQEGKTDVISLTQDQRPHSALPQALRCSPGPGRVGRDRD